MPDPVIPTSNQNPGVNPNTYPFANVTYQVPINKPELTVKTMMVLEDRTAPIPYPTSNVDPTTCTYTLTDGPDNGLMTIASSGNQCVATLAQGAQVGQKQKVNIFATYVDGSITTNVVGSFTVEVMAQSVNLAKLVIGISVQFVKNQ